MSSLIGEPFLTVVIPVWNREKEIVRCLESILEQDYGECEVVVVDDASTDLSAQVVEGYEKRCQGIRLVRHGSNLGTCAARGTGVGSARGQWILFMDSDDRLEPGALSQIAGRARSAPERVGVLGSSLRMQSGEISPDPPLPPSEIDFSDFLRWANKAQRTDIALCHRREVYESLSWPRDRRMEQLFHMMVASRWKQLFSPEVLVRVHTDAAVRWSVPSAARRRLLRRAAKDIVAERDEMLQRFGKTLQDVAPDIYVTAIKRAGFYSFVAGERKQGLQYLLRYLRLRPTELRAWSILVIGLVNAEGLLWLHSKWEGMRHWARGQSWAYGHWRFRANGTLPGKGGNRSD